LAVVLGRGALGLYIYHHSLCQGSTATASFLPIRTTHGLVDAYDIALSMNSISRENRDQDAWALSQWHACVQRVMSNYLSAALSVVWARSTSSVASTHRVHPPGYALAWPLPNHPSPHLPPWLIYRRHSDGTPPSTHNCRPSGTTMHNIENVQCRPPVPTSGPLVRCGCAVILTCTMPGHSLCVSGLRSTLYDASGYTAGSEGQPRRKIEA
jgi:hypothetical protein